MKPGVRKDLPEHFPVKSVILGNAGLFMKLPVLGIKVGEVRKTIVAGIRAHYSAEELKGKKIVVIDNMDPVVIRGVESNGMLLAASDPTALTLIVPERPIPDGAKVK